MAVPDVCRKVRRPGLIFCAFVMFGFLLGPVVNQEVAKTLEQIGQVGFLLLLFEVGLEINLPPLRQFAVPLGHAFKWALAQYPVTFGLAKLAGMNGGQALLASAALTACSVGMAHPAWKSYPNISFEPRTQLLQVMVALELMAIVVLAVETTVLKTGWSWSVALKLSGIGTTVLLIVYFADSLTKLFQTILERTTHWRIHLLVLLVLVVCAAGNRLGLDSAKTAFFLGLAMRRTEHDGIPLEEYIAPISRQFLVPLFFVALGLQIDWQLLLGWVSLAAIGAAGMILAVREILARRWLPTGGDGRSFLLLCPNLTLVALAAKALQDAGMDARLTAWLVLTGLFVTVVALALLPTGGDDSEPAT